MQGAVHSNNTSKRTLLVITTANQLEYTIKGITSIQNCNLNNCDLLVVDDCSVDGTVDFCRENDLDIITKNRPKGLTHSWNISYQNFKKKGYQNLIIANNDILVPKGALENLIQCLENNIIVGAMSTLKGVGHQPAQALSNNYKDLNLDETNPEHYQQIQDILNSRNTDKSIVKSVPYINGFFFGLNRDVINYEFSPDNLFNPANINVFNEDDLCNRIPEEKVFSLKTFIFHYKGISFENHDISPNYDFGRNLTWRDADKLKKSAIKRYWFRFKKKFLK